jgi:hypothetical protein
MESLKTEGHQVESVQRFTHERQQRAIKWPGKSRRAQVGEL